MSNKQQPLVSVVVLNYNGLKFLDRCLSSLLGSNYPNFEVIFVDNASADGSLKADCAHKSISYTFI